MALAPRTVQNIPDCFKPGADHGLAAGFDHAGADKQVAGGETGDSACAPRSSRSRRPRCESSRSLPGWRKRWNAGRPPAFSILPRSSRRRWWTFIQTLWPASSLGCNLRASPRVADARDRDRQSAPRRENVGRQDSRSTRPIAHDHLLFPRGSSRVSRPPRRSACRTLRRFSIAPV